MFIGKFPKKSGNERQIVNLEYGFDTSYWRLKDSNKNVTDFVVMDFPSVTAQKCYLTLRRLMFYIYIYIYGAPILDVSRSHTTTQHSR